MVEYMSERRDDTIAYIREWLDNGYLWRVKWRIEVNSILAERIHDIFENENQLNKAEHRSLKDCNNTKNDLKKIYIYILVKVFPGK